MFGASGPYELRNEVRKFLNDICGLSELWFEKNNCVTNNEIRV